eukprot:gene5514-5749_t
MASLVHVRGIVLNSVAGLMAASLHYLSWQGGTCRAVISDLMLQYQANCLLYLSFNHILRPMLFRNGLLATVAGLAIGLSHLWWTPPALL